MYTLNVFVLLISLRRYISDFILLDLILLYFIKQFLFFWEVLYDFLTPPALPEVPEAWFNVQQTYSLSSLAFKRVTRRSAIKTQFLPPVSPGAIGACSTPIIWETLEKVPQNGVPRVTIILNISLQYTGISSSSTYL